MNDPQQSLDVPKPSLNLELIWEHDLVLGGKSGTARMTLDSAGAAGPSPMQALAFGLAGCMAMDVVHVLRKGRHDLRGLRVDLTGHRAAEAPRRYTRFVIHFTVTGAVAPERVARAIELSRAKYCSVWHSLREDITLETAFDVSEGC
jgi:putative redox protein